MTESELDLITSTVRKLFDDVRGEVEALRATLVNVNGELSDTRAALNELRAEIDEQRAGSTKTLADLAERVEQFEQRAAADVYLEKYAAHGRTAP